MKCEPDRTERTMPSATVVLSSHSESSPDCPENRRAASSEELSSCWGSGHEYTAVEVDVAVASLIERLATVEIPSLVQVREQISYELDQIKQKLDVIQSKRFAVVEKLGTSLRQAVILKDVTQDSGKYFSLENLEEVELAQALRNVSYVLQYAKFMTAAPELITQTQGMLDSIEVGSGNRGSAASIYEAHANVCSLERVRDLALMDAQEGQDAIRMLGSAFAPLTGLRTQVENIVFGQVFAHLLSIARSDPRVLVASVRLVEADEQECDWRARYIKYTGSRGESSREAKAVISRRYRARCIDALKKSIVGGFEDVAVNRQQNEIESIVDGLNSTDKAVEAILSHADAKLDDYAVVQRYVVPCFPEDYDIAGMFVSEYYGQIMQRISEAIAKDPSVPLSRAGKHTIVKWYSRYKATLAHIGIIDPKGEELDRSRVESSRLPALPTLSYVPSSSMSSFVMSLAPSSSKSKEGSVKDCISPIVKGDVDPEAGVSIHPECGDWANYTVEYLHTTLTRRILALIRSDTVVHGGKFTSVESLSSSTLQKSTQLPEAVFSTIESEIRDVTILCEPDLIARLGLTVVDVLKDFQRELRAVLTGRDPYDIFRNPSEPPVVEYICATINNIARCIEYTEEVRDRILQRCKETSNMLVADEYGAVTDSFRSITTFACSKLTSNIESDLKPLTGLFYQPRSGTEVMLDALETLQDRLTEYQGFLLPHLFEELVVLCGEMMVHHYLVPFMDIRVSLKASAVIAQIEKDTEHLTRFLQKYLTKTKKKFLSYIIEPIAVTRQLFMCKSNADDMIAAFTRWSTMLGRKKEICVRFSDEIAIADRIWERRGIKEAIINDVLATIRRNNSTEDKREVKVEEVRWRTTDPLGSNLTGQA